VGAAHATERNTTTGEVSVNATIHRHHVLVPAKDCRWEPRPRNDGLSSVSPYTPFRRYNRLLRIQRVRFVQSTTWNRSRRSRKLTTGRSHGGLYRVQTALTRRNHRHHDSLSTTDSRPPTRSASTLSHTSPPVCLRSAPLPHGRFAKSDYALFSSISIQLFTSRNPRRRRVNTVNDWTDANR